MKLHKEMYSFTLNTSYNTVVFRNTYILDPNIMDLICNCEKKDKREHIMYDYKIKDNDDEIKFIKDVASEFLEFKNYKHNDKEWYMDIVRYNLDNETKPVDSGLAWHCENDQSDNLELITVLMYLRIDNTIRDGNLDYIDSHGIEQIINIEPGTIIIMDGRVEHKPQDPVGSGLRDLIAISFSVV